MLSPLVCRAASRVNRVKERLQGAPDRHLLDGLLQTCAQDPQILGPAWVNAVKIAQDLHIPTTSLEVTPLDARLLAVIDPRLGLHLHQ